MFKEAINTGDRLAMEAYADWLEERGLPLSRGWRLVARSGKFPGKTDYVCAYNYGWKADDGLPIFHHAVCGGTWGGQSELSKWLMLRLSQRVGKGDVSYRAYWGWESPFAALEALAEAMEDEAVL